MCWTAGSTSPVPKFTEAVANKVHYGPVTSVGVGALYDAVAAAVSITEVNLKLIWDVVSQIKVGERGNAYVVGAQGGLIAHPDISLVLRNADMSKLTQVQAALAGGTDAADSLRGALNIQGQEVLTACARLAHIRRASGHGSLCLAVCRTAAAGAGAAGRPAVRRAGWNVSRPAHGRPNHGVARRRRALRRR